MPGFAFQALRRLSLLLLLALLSLPPAQADAYRYSGVERVVAVGDIHGALEEFVAILQGTGLVDAESNWNGGRAHLVSLGDQLDRGDQGRDVLDLLMRLEDQAAAAGGAVHVVLGNHEVMNLTGDLRYVSLGDYAQFAEDAADGGAAAAGGAMEDGAPAGYFERRAAFAPDGEYGRWLLGKPVAIVIDDTLFVHGGISPMMEGLSLDQVNARALDDARRFAEGWHALLQAGVLADGDGFGTILERAKQLAESGEDEPLAAVGAAMVESARGLPFDPDGPLWYRGSARCHPYAEGEVADRVLAGLGARRVAIGHTPTHDRRIASRIDGQVLRIDTGINRAAYQGTPSALVIENGEARAWHAGEGLADIPPEPSRVWERPHGMSDAEIEAFLLNAEVIAEEPQGPHDPGWRRLTLASDGRELRAVFRTVDTAPRLKDRRWSRAGERAERYVYEIAAYRLDRLLGLHMVPVSVEREIGGERGVLRYWIDNALSERQRQAEQVPVYSDCDMSAQYALMNLFDVLILNASPDFGALVYDSQAMLWLYDQSKAFGTASDVGAILGDSGIRPTRRLAAALGSLNEESAAFLSEYLHPRQLEALLQRARGLRALD
jgi:hypothetical protein